MKRFLGVALAVSLLTLPASATADTSMFTGYRAYQGLRLTEHLTVSKRSVTSPSNYINARLPSNAAVDEIHAPTDRATLVAASSNPYFNDTCWSTPISISGPGATMVPVRLWQNGWATSGVPKYKRQLAGILADGVPIPSGWAPETCQGDSDREGAFYSPTLDKLWELWRLNPCDPASCAGFSYTASDGGRMSYVHSNPGHWVTRSNGAAYPGLPTDPAKRATFEDHTWGATAAKLPRLELEVTKEDVQAGVIAHALAFQLPPKYILKGKVWPAQSYDGYATTGIPQGARFRIAPLTNCALTYRVASLVCAAVRDYGAVLADRGGALAFYGAPDVHPFLGVARSKLFADFPFSGMERLQVGSDATPTPTTQGAG
jgi:hypothetical protein